MPDELPPWHVTPNTYRFSEEAIDRIIAYNDQPWHTNHPGYCLMGMLAQLDRIPLQPQPWHKRLRRWMHRNTPLVMRRKTFESRVYDGWDY